MTFGRKKNVGSVSNVLKSHGGVPHINFLFSNFQQRRLAHHFKLPEAEVLSRSRNTCTVILEIVEVETILNAMARLDMVGYEHRGLFYKNVTGDVNGTAANYTAHEGSLKFQREERVAGAVRRRRRRFGPIAGSESDRRPQQLVTASNPSKTGIEPSRKKSSRSANTSLCSSNHNS